MSCVVAFCPLVASGCPRRCLTAALAGCDSFRDLFSAHADVAAEAGGQKLTAERLADSHERGQGRQAFNRETGGLRRQRLGRLRPLRQAVGQRQAAVRLGEHRRGGLARNLRAQGHPLARHAHGPARQTSGPARRTACTRQSDVRVLQQFCSAPPIPRRTLRERGQAEEGRGHAEPAPEGRRLRQPGIASSPKIPGSRMDSGFLPASPKGKFVPRSTAQAGRSRRAR